MDPATAAAFAWRYRKVLAAAVAAALALTVTAAVVIGGAVAGVLTAVSANADTGTPCGTVGTQPATGDLGALSFNLDAEQQADAEQMGQAAATLHAPAKAVVVMYAAALQESSLRNLPGGDLDSVGLFQMRPSQGWGTPAQLQDVAYVTTKFLQTLLLVPGWDAMTVAAAAQAVERSAFPAAYARWEHDAGVLAAQVPGTALAGEGGCGVPSDCPAVSPQQEQHLTPDALAVLRCGLRQFPQIQFTAGWAPGVGHIATSLHYQGRAVDFMLPGAVRSPQATALGNTIADWFYAQRDTYGVTEIIWNARIRTKAHDWLWRPYRNEQCPRTGPCSATLQHLDHVHISVAGNAGTYGTAPVVGGVTLPIPKGGYRLTAGFGECSGLWAHCHTGQDFAAPIGTPIRAVTSGTVVAAGSCVHGCAYGNLTEVANGPSGPHLWYAHQSEIDVTPGQTIAAGQVIGKVGATGNVTGPHLHLEVRVHGTPVDPLPWLRGKGLRP